MHPATSWHRLLVHRELHHKNTTAVPRGICSTAIAGTLIQATTLDEDKDPYVRFVLPTESVCSSPIRSSLPETVKEARPHRQRHWSNCQARFGQQSRDGSLVFLTSLAYWVDTPGVYPVIMMTEFVILAKAGICSPWKANTVSAPDFHVRWKGGRLNPK